MKLLNIKPYLSILLPLLAVSGLMNTAYAGGVSRKFVEQIIFPGKIINSAPLLKYHPLEKTLPRLDIPLRSKPAQMESQTLVKSARVTMLTDMIASRRTLAEWGFSSFVELEIPLKNGGFDKRYVLFDTGGNPDTLNSNLEAISKTDAAQKGIADLKTFMGGKKLDIVLSHWHSDHTTGLANFLRKYCMKDNAVSPDCVVDRIIIGKGFFNSRWEYNPKTGEEKPNDSNANNIRTFLDPQSDLNVMLSKFVVAEKFTNLYPDSEAVWVSGFIPRKSGEDNQASNSYRLILDNGTPEGVKGNDDLPEEISLSFGTAKGAVVITGCAHGGIVNTLFSLYTNTKGLKKIDSIIGGMHLMAADQKLVDATVVGMNKFEMNFVVGGHCTGLDVVYDLKAKLIHQKVQASSVLVRYQLYQKPDSTEYTSIVVNPSPTTLNPIKK